MKNFPLVFIQIAWVLETAALIIYTMAIMSSLEIDRINLWLNSLGTFALLIGGQGGAAFGGPLIADTIQNKKER